LRKIKSFVVSREEQSPVVSDFLSSFEEIDYSAISDPDDDLEERIEEDVKKPKPMLGEIDKLKRVSFFEGFFFFFFLFSRSKVNFLFLIFFILNR